MLGANPYPKRFFLPEENRNNSTSLSGRNLPRKIKCPSIGTNTKQLLFNSKEIDHS